MAKHYRDMNTHERDEFWATYGDEPLGLLDCEEGLAKFLHDAIGAVKQLWEARGGCPLGESELMLDLALTGYFSHLMNTQMVGSSDVPTP